MLTIYTTFRNFDDPHFNIIQRNAVRSWMHLSPTPEIIIMGNDFGVEEICKEMGLIHIKDIPVAASGAPILNSMISLAEKQASNNLMLLIASDMIIFNDTCDACELVKQKYKEFCAGVRRHEVNITSLIDFSDPEWKLKLSQLPRMVSNAGTGDYFLHTKGFYKEMPPFIIGRSKCDNWMYYHAIQKQALVYLTKVVALHQMHHHKHLKTEVDNERYWLKTNEFKHNIKLAQNKVKHIADANWVV